VNADGNVEVIEVKQTTKVHDEHYNDMAFQYYVVQNCGYNISKISLMHINNKYVRQGDIETEKLFTLVDCTEKVMAMQPDIPQRIDSFIQYSEIKEEPEKATGKQCSKPYPCAFFEYCSKGIVQEKKAGKKFNREKLQEFLAQVRYPLCFLDFESLFGEPIPPVDLTRPYQQMPFQYSLHILKSKDEDIENLEHREFLADHLSVENLRAIAEQLCRDIPEDAQVMAYNAKFEKELCIKELARMFPDLSKHLMAIYSNFIDLMSPFQSRHLETLEMKGSYSIKYVLPALVPEFTYEKLEVQNGGMACDTFKLLKDLSPDEKEKSRNNLLEYCGLDTFAMVKILKELEARCEQG
jgi:hypothetical protein